MRARNPEDLHRLFAAALNAGDRDALMSLYEPDATLVPQPGQAAIGKAAIREALVMAGYATANDLGGATGPIVGY
ncbi:MAG: nuclear transport factor 2 family protein, partial [candidate division NC10 bacterium]